MTKTKDKVIDDVAGKFSTLVGEKEQERPAAEVPAYRSQAKVPVKMTEPVSSVPKKGIDPAFLNPPFRAPYALKNRKKAKVTRNTLFLHYVEASGYKWPICRVYDKEVFDAISFDFDKAKKDTFR